jgi:hypothetical protein
MAPPSRTPSAELSPAERATQEQCEMSVSNNAGEAISLEAYWSRLFGDWRRFESSSTLATLAGQAAAAWAEIHAKLAQVEVESVEVMAPVVAALCPLEDCEGGNRRETVDGVRQDMGRCGLCNPEPEPVVAAVEVASIPADKVAVVKSFAEMGDRLAAKHKAAAPTVIKAAPKNSRSRISACTRPDPETFAKIAADALKRAA